MLHQRRSWLEEYTGTTETLFKATAAYTTRVYTARCWGEWQHHIKHALKWWWEHKRDWYENQVKQMNIPRGRKRSRPNDHRVIVCTKSPPPTSPPYLRLASLDAGAGPRTPLK